MKNLNRINLGGLRAVESVARLGTLALAADELGVTPGAVSQQIQKTEAILGAPLFQRHPKGLKPTARCETLLPHLTRGMSELSEAVNIAERRPSDTLVISVAPVFAAKWLVWRLSDFSAGHPDIRIRIDASPALVDPNTSDLDACIRVGQGRWPGVTATKIVDQWAFPVCTDGIARQLTEPKDLASVPIIRDPDAMFGWSVWLGPHGLSQDILPDGPVFSDASLCLDAAIAGQGVFLAWDSLAFDALTSGRLVKPFPEKYRTGISYWFVVGAHRRQAKSLRAFESWLTARMNSECCPGHYLGSLPDRGRAVRAGTDRPPA